MKLANSIVTALIMFAALAPPRPAYAYYDEVHYILTYLIARHAGCTPEQAYRIASADVSVDVAKATEPVQGALPTFTNQTPRWRFHAFRDETADGYSLDLNGNKNLVGRDDSENRRKADQKINAQQVALYTAARDSGNLGVFLHFFQDKVPHQYYSTRGGHWVSPLDTPVPTVGGLTAMNLEILFAQLPSGGTTDWLSYRYKVDPKANDELVVETARSIMEFLAQVSPRQRPPKSVSPDEVKSLLQEVLKKLRDVNKYPEPVLSSDLPTVHRLYDLRAAGKKGTPEEEARFGKHLDGPDLKAARQVINEAMVAARMTEGRIPERPLMYDYDELGGLKDEPAVDVWMRTSASTILPPIPGFLEQPEAARAKDLWVLTGALRVFVQRQDESGKIVPVDVKADLVIKAPVTKAGDTEYVLDRGSVAGGQPAEFAKLPIGDVIVEISAPGFAPKQERVALNRQTTWAKITLAPQEAGFRLRFDLATPEQPGRWKVTFDGKWSIWTLTPVSPGQYQATEDGLGRAKGTASYDNASQTLTLEAVSQDKRYVATYQWNMSKAEGGVTSGTIKFTVHEGKVPPKPVEYVATLEPAPKK
jgi:hypothetical protein